MNFAIRQITQYEGDWDRVSQESYDFVSFGTDFQGHLFNLIFPHHCHSCPKYLTHRTG